MMIQMHSKAPLPEAIRGTFELPIWPYYDGPGVTPVPLMEYLRDLTVFRYEDNYTGGASGQYAYAIIIPDAEGSWAHEWEGPIECFEHLLWVDDGTLEIMEWPNDNPQGFALHRKIKEAVGDNYAWAEFNKKVVLRACNSHVLAYIRGHNTPGNITNVNLIEETSPKRAQRHVRNTDESLARQQIQER